MRLTAVFFLLLFLFQNPCFAISEDQAVRCIAGEARGESLRGQVAVGEVLRRRGSTRGFVGCRYHIVDANEMVKARRAWRLSRRTNYSRGATNFDGTAFPRPKWSKNMKKVCVIGGTIFWKA